MSLIDNIAIHNYHRDKIHKYGPDNARALGWKAQEGQEARFKILCEIGDLSDVSVLDAGCGYGDLRGYFEGKYTGMRYLGIDQLESFLDVAIKKYGHLPETSFFHGDFSAADLPITDYILASGALNYRNSDPDFVFKTITKLFNSCRMGFGFNMLSKIENAHSILIAHDPEMILKHCKSLTSTIVFKDGYYEDDFTFFLKH